MLWMNGISGGIGRKYMWPMRLRRRMGSVPAYATIGAEQKCGNQGCRIVPRRCRGKERPIKQTGMVLAAGVLVGLVRCTQKVDQRVADLMDRVGGLEREVATLKQEQRTVLVRTRLPEGGMDFRLTPEGKLPDGWRWREINGRPHFLVPVDRQEID
jgi:hypothetical protein